MIVHITIRKQEGTITVHDGQADVIFPEAKIKILLENYLNGVQDITFRNTGLDGSPRDTTTNAIPAADDGLLVYVLNSGVPGLKKKITITGVEGSDKVSFMGSGQ